MKPTFLCYFILFLFFISCKSYYPTSKDTLSSFKWRTGNDPATRQMIPPSGNDALLFENGKAVVHVKFQVKQYGELSFPINTKTPGGAEALRADLSKNKAIRVTYRANHEFILQLRQTGVHGGTQNHVSFPASKKDTTVLKSFAEFAGGLKPLDLTDVSKFNFAFLSNDPETGYAELQINRFAIE